ncbi:MAG: N-6 DNA methylase, partial [Bacteroidota bacterium]
MKKQKSIERSDLLTSQSNRKNKYGQYFTPKQIAEFMVDLAEVPINSAVLEPCSGKGVFLDTLHEKGFTKITSYEIDETLIEKKHKTINESFVSASINKKFKLIIGNPPYIRWANLEDELKVELINNPLWNKYFNSLCDYLYFFILKSIELLEDEGQLIFICPEYWLNTTHSLSLRNYMASNGYFESIYHFNETPIFKGVTISSIIFKYIKSHKVRPKV